MSEEQLTPFQIAGMIHDIIGPKDDRQAIFQMNQHYVLTQGLDRTEGYISATAWDEKVAASLVELGFAVANEQGAYRYTEKGKVEARRLEKISKTPRNFSQEGGGDA